MFSDGKDYGFEDYGRKKPFISDLEGLRAYDTNGNGSLDSGDAAYAGFGVWKDANSDALVDPGELLSLGEIGLMALALDGYLTGASLKGKGNVIYATTDAVFADNRTVRVADVLLGYDAKGSSRQAGALESDGTLGFPPAPDLDSGTFVIA